MVVLETARLIVRDHRVSDLEGVVALMTSPENMRYVPELRASNADAARKNLAASIAEQENQSRTKYFFAYE